VLKAGVERAETELANEAVQLVRDQIGPVAAFRSVLIVKRLPKTRSGKILRGTLRCIADGEAYTMPATIDDPEILEEISARLAEAGFRSS
jgi:propionyl-CoA synthetase